MGAHVGAKLGQRFTLTDFSDDCDVGGHAEESGDQASEVDGGSVGSCGASLELGDVRQRQVEFEDLFGGYDPQRRVELGGAARQQRRLARTRCSGEHDRRPCTDAGTQEAGCRLAQGVTGHQLGERGEGDAGELSDVHQDVPAPAELTMHDVQAGAVDELRVLEAL